MIDAAEYTGRLSDELLKVFGGRLVYVGLQGSYRRGEASKGSDIDIFTVIDDFSPADLDAYRAVIESMEACDRSCGFICGRDELKAWNRLEVCQLLHETADCRGVLAELLPEYDRTDVVNYVKLTVGNIFHEICHRYIHMPPENSAEKLKYAYKPVLYALQNLHFLRTGDYILRRDELICQLKGDDRRVLEMSLRLKNGEAVDFNEAFSLLFKWCQATLTGI